LSGYFTTIDSNYLSPFYQVELIEYFFVGIPCAWLFEVRDEVSLLSITFQVFYKGLKRNIK